MNSFYRVFTFLGFVALTACSGSGDGGVAGTVSGSAIPTSKEPLCSNQSCVNQSGASSLAFGAEGTAFDSISSNYASSLQIVGRLNDLIEGYNQMAANEGILKCEDLPNTETLIAGGDNGYKGVLNAGDKTIDFEGESIEMDHKVLWTYFGDPVTELQFKCVSDTEVYFYMISKTFDETLTEQSYFHYTSTTNFIEYVQSSQTDPDFFFRFKENSTTGDVQFLATNYNGLDGLGDPYYTKSIFKNIEVSTFPGSYVLEVAYTQTTGTDLDSVPFGIDNGTGDVRTCVYDPQITPMVDNDPTNNVASDCDEEAPEALIPAQDPMIGNNVVKSWDEDFLDSITFPAIE